MPAVYEKIKNEDIEVRQDRHVCLVEQMFDSQGI